MSDDLVKRLRAQQTAGKLVQSEPGVLEMTYEDDALTTDAADLIEAQAARIERLEAAMRSIRELNTMPPDENGHRWVNSGLIQQEIVAALQEGQA